MAHKANKGGTAETQAFAPCFGAEAFLFSGYSRETDENLTKGEDNGKEDGSEDNQDFRYNAAGR